MPSTTTNNHFNSEGLSAPSPTASSGSVTLSSSKGYVDTDPIHPPTTENPKITSQASQEMKKDPSQYWDESRFNLSSPRLTNPGEVSYNTRTAEQSAYTDHTTRICRPVVAVPDDDDDDNNNKTLFVHPRYRNLTWTGKWAAAKLAREEARYNRVKRLLFLVGALFEDGVGDFPTLDDDDDDKYLYVAHTCREEMRSPWVVAWLEELIGYEDVAKILAHLEWV